jgi:septum site-determining protein MinC
MLQPHTPEIPGLFPLETKAIEPVIELKGSVFTLPVLCLRSCDLGVIDAQLGERLAKSPKFFDNAPIVVDLEAVRDAEKQMDFGRVVQLMRARGLFPVGVQNGSPLQNDAAMVAGLAIVKGRAMKELPTAANRRKTGSAKPNPEISDDPDADENIHATPPSAPPETPIPTQTVRTTSAKVIHHPVRSGQRIVARDGDLIVLAAVNAGAEIIAEGNIHVYAPLRGRALAGVSGDIAARIFCQHMEAELVAVAGNYRVFEDNMPDELRGKAAQVYLNGEQLIVEPLV